jgi:hypothetical protein
MKRRTFLQTTGFALAGGHAMAQGQPASQPSGPTVAAKSVLVTSADSPLAQAIATGLSDQYRTVLTKSDFSDPAATTALVHGVDAIVHVAEPPADAPAAAHLDYRTRGTYGLLQAAFREGVRQAVYLSSLEVMFGYDEQFQVTEDWCPKPAAEPGPMSHYLGEFTCREFAREGKIGFCVLRLGRLGLAGDPLRLDQADAVGAVECALTVMGSERARLGLWSVFHIVSDVRNSRFPAAKASQMLGYRPQSAG